ncbi:MAG: PBP1A family penicillin-binding protein [Acidobacteria bacterium]|nr:MAG: PBP1A family penicillin-binding protein [Acidobacteriota bacterium]
MAHIVLRIARHAGLVALFLLAGALGIVTGILFAYAGDLPRISALDDYSPNTITRVLASSGQVVAEFATERRVVVKYEDMSPRLREAILSAEDAGFDRHVGVSISRIFITAVEDVVKGRMAGASTLTQQLARKLFLTDEKTWERKIKEALLAIQIEKRYTKPEIFTFYCNQIYFGHGAYGVEAASRLYFGKRSKDLTLEEAAMIAGIIQTPERQSPFVDVRRATRRRNYVLGRMAEEKYITREEAEAAMQKPVLATGQPAQDESIAPYFVEEVRKHLERTYGAKHLYEKGLSVYTSLDVELQRAANDALDRGLRTIDKRRGFRRPQRNILAEGRALDQYQHEKWTRPFEVGQVVPALVVTVAGRPAVAPAARAADAAASRPLAAGAVRVRMGAWHADLGREAVAWTRRKGAAELLKAGDLIEVRLLALDEKSRTATVSLEQEPLLDGALLAIENRTGQILAMVGGRSFSRSKFNRATQAYRQMGSGFKPFLYTAAIDRGLTPASPVLDAPVSFPSGPGQPPYSPSNYDRKFEGVITLRRALEQSRNVPAVRTMDLVGPKHVVEYARRFGFHGPMEPYLSLALGAAEASLMETVAAYSVFPNQGVLMRPFQILRVVDRDGNVLEENRPQSKDAIRADTAYVLTSLLRGVVQRGTAASAASLGWPLAGKTGTTNDYTDAWFTGFDPNITVGVWVGHDDKKPLGPSETGTQAALPIWIRFMKAYIERRGDRQNPPAFQAPGNIVFVSVDRTTGSPLGGDTPGAISEAFIAGTQPGGIR